MISPAPEQYRTAFLTPSGSRHMVDVIQSLEEADEYEDKRYRDNKFPLSITMDANYS